MMTPLESRWSVVPWTRYTAEPPNSAPIGTAEIEGVTVDVFDQMDPEWHREHVRHGAQIHDHDRDVTYKATINQRGELDHLEVIVHGYIDDNTMRRVPVARIRRVVLEQVGEFARVRANHGEGVLSLVLPGGLTERPDLEEVARLMREGWDRKRFHEAWPEPDWPHRTVDGWMRRARQKYPTDPPSGQTARTPKKENNNG